MRLVVLLIIIAFTQSTLYLRRLSPSETITQSHPKEYQFDINEEQDVEPILTQQSEILQHHKHHRKHHHDIFDDDFGIDSFKMFLQIQQQDNEFSFQDDSKSDQNKNYQSVEQEEGSQVYNQIESSVIDYNQQPIENETHELSNSITLNNEPENYNSYYEQDQNDQIKIIQPELYNYSNQKSVYQQSDNEKVPIAHQDDGAQNSNVINQPENNAIYSNQDSYPSNEYQNEDITQIIQNDQDEINDEIKINEIQQGDESISDGKEISNEQSNSNSPQMQEEIDQQTVDPENVIQQQDSQQIQEEIIYSETDQENVTQEEINEKLQIKEEVVNQQNNIPKEDFQNGSQEEDLKSNDSYTVEQYHEQIQNEDDNYSSKPENQIRQNDDNVKNEVIEFSNQQIQKVQEVMNTEDENQQISDITVQEFPTTNNQGEENNSSQITQILGGEQKTIETVNFVKDQTEITKPEEQNQVSYQITNIDQKEQFDSNQPKSLDVVIEENDQQIIPVTQDQQLPNNQLQDSQENEQVSDPIEDKNYEVEYDSKQKMMKQQVEENNKINQFNIIQDEESKFSVFFFIQNKVFKKRKFQGDLNEVQASDDQFIEETDASEEQNKILLPSWPNEATQQQIEELEIGYHLGEID